jgi:hypothetical protein
MGGSERVVPFAAVPQGDKNEKLSGCPPRDQFPAEVLLDHGPVEVQAA